MKRIEKTVFISYRRENVPWALAIFQYLTQQGFDVFFDYSGVDSGAFEKIIIENIRSRAHFLVLLTPSALDDCSKPNDWLRREIEIAIDSRRNVIPLIFEGFDFGAPPIATKLTGELAQLREYNGMGVPAEYFDAAMDKLCARFLKVPLDAVIHPASPTARRAAASEKAEAVAAPAVPEKELSAQEFFERGYRAADAESKIHFYTEAIRLKPDYASAFNNRGAARETIGDNAGAREDCDQALKLKPDFALAFLTRGSLREKQGDLTGAMADYTEAIRLEPNDPAIHIARGFFRETQGDNAGALQDYEEAMRLREGRVPAADPPASPPGPEAV